MSVFGAALAIAVTLMAEALLGRVVPAVHGHLDLMMILVAWYALRGSQRSAMLVGCAAGLLQDVWFGLGVFGMNGFKKTLLGWFLGGLASRLDLNHGPGRIAAGVVLVLGDRLVGSGLYRLLDLETGPVVVWKVALEAAVTGLLVAAAFPLTERARPRRAL